VTTGGSSVDVGVGLLGYGTVGSAVNRLLVENADDIERALVERHGISPERARVLSVLADGRLGQVTVVRTRLSHDGALGDGWLPDQFFDPAPTGGGALIDLGCHPMYLTRLFLGEMPESVTAVFGHLTGRAVEDNAVAVLQCSAGALGVVEAGFVNRHSPFTIEVHGTEGSLIYGTPDRKLRLQTAAEGGHGGWSEVPVPEDGPSPFWQWVSHIEYGSTATENIALAIDLTALMDAANRAASTGAKIGLG